MKISKNMFQKATSILDVIILTRNVFLPSARCRYGNHAATRERAIATVLESLAGLEDSPDSMLLLAIGPVIPHRNIKNWGQVLSKRSVQVSLCTRRRNNVLPTDIHSFFPICICHSTQWCGPLRPKPAPIPRHPGSCLHRAPATKHSMQHNSRRWTMHVH